MARIVGFLLLVACGSLRAQVGAVPVAWSAVGDTSHTYISAHTLRVWALLYREFRTEFLECLYGVRRGDSVTVRFGVLANVLPRHSMTNGVKPHPEGMCPVLAGDSLVGVAHSHPKERAAINGERLPVDPNTELCFESWPDIKSFMESHLPVSVVVCGFGRIYVLRRGTTPNVDSNICQYSPEDDGPPPLRCGKKPTGAP